MKSYRCVVEKTDEYIITIDEDKLGEEQFLAFEDRMPGGIIDLEEYAGTIAEALSAGRAIGEEYRVSKEEARHYLFDKDNKSPIHFTRKRATLETSVDEVI